MPCVKIQGYFWCASCFMRYIWQHIETIIGNYNGGLPLTHFLKNYFKLHRKLGSRDRKILSEMAYCWFRCSKALPAEMNFEERIKYCLFVCETSVPQILQFLPENLQPQKSLSINERIAVLKSSGVDFDLDKIGLPGIGFSKSFEQETYLMSILQQPRLFIRMRKQQQQIEKQLSDHNISFNLINGHCLSLPNGAPVDKILSPDTYVVQDASSQATGTFFQPKAHELWWDCCSGAGGKSLLLKDIEPGVQLTVSDKRSSILHNLAERFKLYGYPAPTQKIVDMTDANELRRTLGNELFDNIICDVPCTGSGTWARTPEQLYFFDGQLVEEFSKRQMAIAVNASEYLKKGGRLIYITCSIFYAENEEVVDAILKETSLTLDTVQLLNGIDMHADSMFIAVFRK